MRFAPDDVRDRGASMDVFLSKSKVTCFFTARPSLVCQLTERELRAQRFLEPAAHFALGDELPVDEVHERADRDRNKGGTNAQCDLRTELGPVHAPTRATAASAAQRSCACPIAAPLRTVDGCSMAPPSPPLLSPAFLVERTLTPCQFAANLFVVDFSSFLRAFLPLFVSFCWFSVGFPALARLSVGRTRQPGFFFLPLHHVALTPGARIGGGAMANVPDRAHILALVEEWLELDRVRNYLNGRVKLVKHGGCRYSCVLASCSARARATRSSR